MSDSTTERTRNSLPLASSQAESRPFNGDWSSAGTYTGKSADVTVTPTTPGNPIQIEVRVQLRKSNQNYGQLSQIATVTLNP